MLKKYSLNTLQFAINAALTFDEQMPAKIRALEGKTLKLVITPFNTPFFIHFTASELQLFDKYDGLVDTIIHSNLVDLLRLSRLPASKTRSLFNDKIRMSGDIELGQKVKQLFDGLDIDWEGHLAKHTGDVVAYQIGSLVRRGIECKNRVNESLQFNISEYLHEEVRVLPSQHELDDFLTDVDDLSLAVERLQARLNQLMSQKCTR